MKISWTGYIRNGFWPHSAHIWISYLQSPALEIVTNSRVWAKMPAAADQSQLYLTSASLTFVPFSLRITQERQIHALNNHTVSSVFNFLMVAQLRSCSATLQRAGTRVITMKSVPATSDAGWFSSCGRLWINSLFIAPFEGASLYFLFKL